MYNALEVELVVALSTVQHLRVFKVETKFKFMLRLNYHVCSTSPPKCCMLESAHAPPPLHVSHAPPHVLCCHLPLLALLLMYCAATFRSSRSSSRSSRSSSRSSRSSSRSSRSSSRSSR